MPLQQRRGLKALIAGRNEGTSSKETPKEKDTGKLPPPPPPPTTATGLLPIPDLKRKKKVVDLDVEEGEVSPRQQRGGKQQRKDDRRASSPRHRGDSHSREVQLPQVWAPRLDLDGTPITVNASIREFQNGHSGYVAEALELPLLLPRDMDTVRSWRQADLFMSMKRDLAMGRDPISQGGGEKSGGTETPEDGVSQKANH
ncbi:hypothetical protein SO802_014383 [Lithocarpus litseifolius]|uniref:Uncharacterized protein n=1 Tax=Lithocarpus litseifolius TaxID=425828 RepID=A0AAW2CSZ1_9ROSI